MTDNYRQINMKLRFEVDQAECFRKGIDCPKSIVTIEVDPAKIPEPERILIADRLMGIDVCQLWNSGEGTTKEMDNHQPVRVKADAPTYEGLMKAVHANQKEVEARQARHRDVALAVAGAGVDTVGMAKDFSAHAAKVENAKDAKRRNKTQ